jgi:hypothetical protein
VPGSARSWEPLPDRTKRPAKFRPRSRPGDALPVHCRRSAQGGSIAGNRYASVEYLSGLVAVAYLLGLFYALALVRTVLPRVCWVTRLEHHWIGLWMH